MVTLYGRARKGERIYDFVPDVRYERISIISTVRLNGETLPMMFPGALDSAVFSKYASYLNDHLGPGDILVMDNLSAHKSADSMKALKDAGINVLYLSPYSPDYNPIELMWNKIKTFVRYCRPRNAKILQSVVKEAFDSVTTGDISEWFSCSLNC
jgi:transposase